MQPAGGGVKHYSVKFLFCILFEAWCEVAQEVGGRGEGDQTMERFACLVIYRNREPFSCDLWTFNFLFIFVIYVIFLHNQKRLYLLWGY